MADPGLRSKFIAMQQEDAANKVTVVGRFIDAAARERKESLRMSRSHILEQLSRARHVRHRRILRRALRALELEMKTV